MDNSTIRILVLDDEPFMLKLISQALTKLGFICVTACDSGVAALAHVDSVINPPDLILLDLNMPDMDGIEFSRNLVQRGYKGALILISGEDERLLQTAENLIHAHKITILGHIKKPVSLENLSTLIKKWTPLAGQAAQKMTYTANELSEAIKNKEFVNYYQPKVCLATREVTGVEALVRWMHPIDGIVLPEHFISLAEQTKLIDDLTRLVLTNALAQASLWRQAGLKLEIGINISMDNLMTLDFADFVVNEAAMKPAIPSKDILLEVTESRLMQDERVPLDILTRLRLKRFRLSIDDFGTGSSSLARLRNIPFDQLKIDQSFVHNAWKDPTARVMFETSLGLGKQLNMEVVAEGVEDKNDWDFVQKSGCDQAQGYYIAHPMPAAELINWMALWAERFPLLQLSES